MQHMLQVLVGFYHDSTFITWGFSCKVQFNFIVQRPCNLEIFAKFPKWISQMFDRDSNTGPTFQLSDVRELETIKYAYGLSKLCKYAISWEVQSV